MAKLTDTQLIVLSSAAARDDGIAVVPAENDQGDGFKTWSQPRYPQADARGAFKARHARLAARVKTVVRSA